MDTGLLNFTILVLERKKDRRSDCDVFVGIIMCMCVCVTDCDEHARLA